MLLTLKDGAIIDIKEEFDYENGCETCDFGSRYVNCYEIYLTKYILNIECINMYEYAISEGNFMAVILPNIEKIETMKELEFIEWLLNELKMITDATINYILKNI